MDLIASIILISIMLMSLLVWGMILQSWSNARPLIDQAVPATRPRPLLSIALALGWIMVQTLSLLTRSEQVGEVDKFNEGHAIRLLISNLLIQILTACILTVSLSQLGRQGLTRFGIDLRHPGKAIRIGAFGYLTAVLPVLIANVSIMPLRTEDNQHVFLQILNAQQSIPLVALMAVSAVIMAPIEEELLYRVVFQGLLQRHLSPWGSIIISSLGFSAVHGFPDMVGLMPLAIVLGYLYWRTGSYLTVVTTHALFNGATLLLTVLAPEH